MHLGIWYEELLLPKRWTNQNKSQHDTGHYFSLQINTSILKWCVFHSKQWSSFRAVTWDQWDFVFEDEKTRKICYHTSLKNRYYCAGKLYFCNSDEKKHIKTLENKYRNRMSPWSLPFESCWNNKQHWAGPCQCPNWGMEQAKTWLRAHLSVGKILVRGQHTFDAGKDPDSYDWLVACIMHSHS